MKIDIQLPLSNEFEISCRLSLPMTWALLVPSTESWCPGPPRGTPPLWRAVPGCWTQHRQSWRAIIKGSRDTASGSIEHTNIEACRLVEGMLSLSTVSLTPHSGYRTVGTAQWVPHSGYRTVGTAQWVPHSGYCNENQPAILCIVNYKSSGQLQGRSKLKLTNQIRQR